MIRKTKSGYAIPRAVRIALLGSACVPFAGPALAQDAAPALEEVIVTAQKREQRLQDVPTTVSVLSGEALDAAQITEVNQLSTLSPSIFINSDQTGRNSKVKIRGVGPDEQSTLRPAVGFFYNDIPLLNQLQGGLSVASDLDLGDLDRVEVLQGPQSTLFGESVSGGAIAFYNRRPSGEDPFNGKVSIVAGDHDLQQIRGSIGGPLGEKFAFRAAAHHNEYQDQVVNTVDGSRRKLEGEGYSAQLLFEPTDYLRFILEFNHRESRQDGGANDGMDAISYGAGTIAAAAAQGITLTPQDPFDRKVQMVFPFHEELVNELTSLHVNWDINDQWSLTSVTGYQDNQDHYGGDEPIAGGYNASNGVIVGFFATGEQRIHYTTEELRLNFAGDRLDSMFGVFYGDYQAPLSRGDFGSVFPGFIFPLAQYVTVDKQTWSVFNHNSWRFSGRLGARVRRALHWRSRTMARTASCLVSAHIPVQPLDTSLFPQVSSDEDAWGGTLKLLRDLNDQVTVYAGIDRGFRLGGINNLGQPNYDTEIALNYEIGLKGLFLDNTLRLNASVFLTDYDGYQVVQYNSEAFTFIVQNADVIGQGVELDAQWAPTSGLELGASVAWNDTYYDSFLGAPCDSYQLAIRHVPERSRRRRPGPDRRAAVRRSEMGRQPERSVHRRARLHLARMVHARRVRRTAGSSLSHPVGDGGDPMQEIGSYGLVNASLGISSDAGLGHHAVGQKPHRQGLLHEHLASAGGLGARLRDRPHRDGAKLRRQSLVQLLIRETSRIVVTSAHAIHQRPDGFDGDFDLISGSEGEIPLRYDPGAG